MGFQVPSSFRCEYPVTRPFSSRYFTPSIFVVGIIWLVVITIVNIIVVGYETVPFTSMVYNSTAKLWYERFNPFWIPPGRSCDPALIPLGTGLDHVVTELNSKGWLLQVDLHSILSEATTIQETTVRQMD